MKIILWILVDKGGRIMYTGSTKSQIENYLSAFDYSQAASFRIAKLAGEVEF